MASSTRSSHLLLFQVALVEDAVLAVQAAGIDDVTGKYDEGERATACGDDEPEEGVPLLRFEAVYFVKGLELVHPGGYLYPFDGVLHGDVAGIKARAFDAFSLVGEYLGLAQ